MYIFRILTQTDQLYLYFYYGNAGVVPVAFFLLYALVFCDAKIFIFD